MKRLSKVLLFLNVIVTSLIWAQPAMAQITSPSSAHGTASSTAGNTVSTGNIDMTGVTMIHECVAYYDGGGAPTLTTSPVNTITFTWTIRSFNEAGTNDAHIKCVEWNVPTVSSTMTFTATCTGCAPSLIVVGFTGTKVTTPNDTEATNSCSGTSCTVGTLTPSASSNVACASVGYSGAPSGITYPSGYTTAQQTAAFAGSTIVSSMACKIGGLGGTESPVFSWTGSQTSVGASMMDYKQEPVTGGTYRSMTGYGK